MAPPPCQAEQGSRHDPPEEATVQTIQQAAAQFLSKKRIAVTGVSRSAQNHGANVVFNRLRDRGYDVFPVNPNTEQVEGVTSYHDLHSIPGGVDAVVIATAPSRAEGTMRECDELGIEHVWMHRSYGAGSVNEAAATYGREHGITVIDGGCPLMFDPTADFGHKVMRVVYRSHVPRTV
ncbi:CoA-binding protein [Knoellia sp. p5-6-4]|uniref:CoA-binding protein n=1 Tax=unclassified Knoellia TaxID=2618719 RepID=UPI0023DB4229|nr:CoA-binding protein [Knoellia sp. p5-6-4]MDF2143536.1 CoA-binding protein [Knoellia sp. p5-6-4]